MGLCLSIHYIFKIWPKTQGIWPNTPIPPYIIMTAMYCYSFFFKFLPTSHRYSDEHGWTSMGENMQNKPCEQWLNTAALDWEKESSGELETVFKYLKVWLEEKELLLICVLRGIRIETSDWTDWTSTIKAARSKLDKCSMTVLMAVVTRSVQGWPKCHMAGSA